MEKSRRTCLWIVVVAAFLVMQGGGEDGLPPMQRQQGQFLLGPTGGGRLVLPGLRGGSGRDKEEDEEGGAAESLAGQDSGLGAGEGSSEDADVVPPSGMLSKKESDMAGAQNRPGRKRVKSKQPPFVRSRPDKTAPLSPRREALRSALTSSDFPMEPEGSALPPEAEFRRGTSPEGGRSFSSAKSGAGLGMLVEDSIATDNGESLGTPSIRQGSVHGERPVKTPSNRKEVIMQLLGE